MTLLFQISMLSYRKPPSCEFHVGFSEAAESALTDAKYAAVLHLNRMGADNFFYIRYVDDKCCMNPVKVEILRQLFYLRNGASTTVSGTGTMNEEVISLSFKIQNILCADRNFTIHRWKCQVFLFHNTAFYRFFESTW